MKIDFGPFKWRTVKCRFFANMRCFRTFETPHKIYAEKIAKCLWFTVCPQCSKYGQYKSNIGYVCQFQAQYHSEYSLSWEFRSSIFHFDLIFCNSKRWLHFIWELKLWFCFIYFGGMNSIRSYNWSKRKQPVHKLSLNCIGLHKDECSIAKCSHKWIYNILSTASKSSKPSSVFCMSWSNSSEHIHKNNKIYSRTFSFRLQMQSMYVASSNLWIDSKKTPNVVCV